jgi:hypothetical protein
VDSKQRDGGLAVYGVGYRARTERHAGLNKGSHAKDDSARSATDLRDRAFDDEEARVAVVEISQCIDGGADVVDGAVKFLLRVR